MNTTFRIALASLICFQATANESQESPEKTALIEEQSQLIKRESKLTDELVKIRERKVELDKLLSTNTQKQAKTFVSDFDALIKLDKSKGNLFRVRQSLIDPASLEKPALLQYSAPHGGPDSFSADLGVSYEWLQKSWRGGNLVDRISAEYHFSDKSNESEKNSLFIGYGVDLRTESGSKDVQDLTLDFGYKHDEILSGDSLLASGYWLPKYEKLHIGNLNRNRYFWYRFSPFFGGEAEAGDGAIKNAKDGDRETVKAGLDLTGAVFPNYFGNRLEISLAETAWLNLNRSGAYEEYQEDQFTNSASLTVWMDNAAAEDGILREDEKHVGLTLKYLNGDNPLTGEFDQNIWTAGLSLKY